MAKRINYRYERAERERQQAQRRAEREARRAARRAAPSVDEPPLAEIRAGEPAGSGATDELNGTAALAEPATPRSRGDGGHA